MYLGNWEIVSAVTKSVAYYHSAASQPIKVYDSDKTKAKNQLSWQKYVRLKISHVLSRYSSRVGSEKAANKLNYNGNNYVKQITLGFLFLFPPRHESKKTMNCAFGNWRNWETRYKHPTRDDGIGFVDFLIAWFAWCRGLWTKH